MGDLGVSNFVMGTVGTIASFIYGVGSLIGGPLGDKIGEKKTIALFLAFSGISTFLMFFASNIIIYALALVLIAAWASLYHPTANSLISKTFRSGTAEAMGLHGMGGALGVMLTPTIAWFIGSYFGWQFAFIFFGILCIILAILLVKSLKKSENKTVTKIKFREVFRIPELWIILVFNITIGLFMKGVEYFFPTYLKHAKGIDPMWASIAFTLILASGVPAQWFGGKAADLFGSRKVLIVTSLGVVLSLFTLQFSPIPLLGIALFIALYGMSFYAHQPALNSLTGLLSPESLRGTVYGIFFFTSFGIGSISQSIAGYCADNYGLESAFYLLTIFALAALVISIMLPRRRENKTKQ
ncbi:MFS transporter [Candidatus Bathyarchaeota archaeon]|nr:MFS transporter [Candidatus Bathyarchaeota archaeon]